MTPAEVARRVEACELDVLDFGHHAHVQLAWHYLSSWPLLPAIAMFAETLRRFASHHGAAAKYHETITIAYMLIVADRRARAPGEWEVFARDNRDLLEDGRALLLAHYSAERLGSDEARTRFVLPRC